MSLFELERIAGLGDDQDYISTLKTNFPEAYKKGRYMKAISVLSNRSPNLFIEPSWQRYIQVESFTPDPRYDTYQWWNFDVVNIPEALDILGQEVKPVNVAVLDSGSPFSIDPAYAVYIDTNGAGIWKIMILWQMMRNLQLVRSVMVPTLVVPSQC